MRYLTLHALTNIHYLAPIHRGLIKVLAHALVSISWLTTHSWLIIHYMWVSTFMIRITLYAHSHIHAPVHIICESGHSWYTPHYMLGRAFIALVLTERPYKAIGVHDTLHIAWKLLHSCPNPHCMPMITFMQWRTLYGRLYIHALWNIACKAIHSCFSLHYMCA
jgi:hypothetical protein